MTTDRRLGGPAPATSTPGTYAMGVDLGTTYTAAAVHRGGSPEVVAMGHRATVEPSVVFVPAEGEVLVGTAAVRRGASEPHRLARQFKRRMGDSIPLILGGAPWSAEALMARLLGWVVRTVSEQEGGPPSRMAVTYPANWGEFKQDRLAQALRMAGLDGVTSLTEPEAAAISYAAAERVPVGEVVAVYDLGGGTFDATVFRKADAGFELLGSPEGVERLGGVDIDEAVFAHVRTSLGAAFNSLDDEDPATVAAVGRLRADCVDAKEALSSDVHTSIPVALPGLHTEVRLTRGELEDMASPLLAESMAALRRAIDAAGLSPKEVDRVLLVGGASRMPLVGRMVSEAVGRPFFVDANPKHAVALGAALQADQRPETHPTQGSREPLHRLSQRPATRPTAGPSHRLSQRELHLFILVDVSGSMAPDGKMPSLNTAVEEALPHLRGVAEDAPGLSVFVRVVAFGSSARWIAEPVAIESFAWEELEAERAGLTELGAAVDQVLAELRALPVATLVPPALLLVSDGMPTDVTAPSFEDAMRRLEADPLGRAATRMAVGIGRDADPGTLRRFIGESGGEPVQADSPQQLMVQVRERISAVVQSASEVV